MSSLGARLVCCWLPLRPAASIRIALLFALASCYLKFRSSARAACPPNNLSAAAASSPPASLPLLRLPGGPWLAAPGYRGGGPCCTVVVGPVAVGRAGPPSPAWLLVVLRRPGAAAAGAATAVSAAGSCSTRTLKHPHHGCFALQHQ